MLDRLERQINYARVSVTDRCNLRCVYCMPKQGGQSNENPLSLETLLQVCTAFASLGISKIKVTGGEPLVREDIIDILRGIKNIPGIKNVTLTTNGILLPRLLEELSKEVLDSINISLDSVSAISYKNITRTGHLEDALAGLNRSIDYFKNIKINCVVIAGLNDNEIEDMAMLAQNKNVSVRFIEIMPLSLAKQYKTVPQKEIAARLEKRFGPITPSNGHFGNGPAVYYNLPGFLGKIGFISAISHRFCDSCNRVRLTSAGHLKTCLHFRNGLDLRPLFAQKASTEELALHIKKAIYDKPSGHVFDSGLGEFSGEYEEELAGMSRIGG